MNSRIKPSCGFWILFGKQSLYYCGLSENHEGDHQIAIPKDARELDEQPRIQRQ